MHYFRYKVAALLLALGFSLAWFISVDQANDVAAVALLSDISPAGSTTSTATSSPTPTPTSTIGLTLTPTSTPVCGLGWQVVSSPNATSRNNLNAVDAVSANDIWAVGTQDVGPQGTIRTLIQHWDGFGWSIVPSPNFAAEQNVLTDIKAISANDVWAVGYYGTLAGYTFTLHWDGAQWTAGTARNPSTRGNYFSGVTATASNDVWAVGYYIEGEFGFNYRTLVERWNGSSWSIVPSPNPDTTYNFLNSVAAINGNPNDIWATGRVQNAVTFTIHWDGAQWTLVPSENPGYNNHLYGISGIASNDVWAVGYKIDQSRFYTLVQHWNGSQWQAVPNTPVGLLYRIEVISTNNAWAVGETTFQAAPQRTLVLHWDGATWSVVPSPNIGGSNNLLADLSVVADNDIWAVGAYSIGNPQSPRQTLIERYYDPCGGTTTPTVAPTVTTGMPSATPSGTTPVPTFTPVSTITPALPTWTPQLPTATIASTALITTHTRTPTATATSATSSPTSSPTAVGSASTSTSTASPTTDTPTGTPPTATSTFTPSSVPTTSATSTAIATSTSYTTASATATTCQLEFTDVPEGSTFYPFAHCLACRGIISGYNTGCESGNPCFRPQNNVTRGQTAKIVSNAAGFSEPVGAQQFEDVPPGSTFYDYIWRLASRGYISGYECGTPPAGPCSPPLNLPYFLPSNNVTRGQLAKIDSNVALYSEPPTDQQFEDVPVGSTFYTYTFRLALHGVMAGYSCGTPPAGPCIQPDNYSYFMPGSTSTRGQTAKIVANTFFPNCSLNY